MPNAKTSNASRGVRSGFIPRAALNKTGAPTVDASSALDGQQPDNDTTGAPQGSPLEQVSKLLIDGLDPEQPTGREGEQGIQW